MILPTDYMLSEGFISIYPYIRISVYMEGKIHKCMALSRKSIEMAGTLIAGVSWLVVQDYPLRATRFSILRPQCQQQRTAPRTQRANQTGGCKTYVLHQPGGGRRHSEPAERYSQDTHGQGDAAGLGHLLR